MTSLSQRIYWKTPYFFKNRLASWNARRLSRERFGPDYEQILREIASHDKWTPEQFAEYQCQELRKLLQCAVANVSYYRRVFSQAGIDPKSITGPEGIRRLPILEKETVRANPAGLLDERLDKARLLIGHTSGTTGTPLILYGNIWLSSAAFAYLDARWHSIAGMQRRINRSVSIGGHLVTAPKRDKPPFWVHNHRWKQLYMSSYHLSPKYLGYYVENLRKFKADYIEGYPSSVHAIAQHIIDNNLEPVPFKACFTTAETLFDYQREAIKKAFGCRTYNQYGCGEMAVFAAECEHGSMHLSPEFGIVEVVDDNDRPVPDGQTGQLVCTSLINRIQLFIRYRVGDLGALRTGRCSCGSPLPMLGSIEGRTDAVLIARDGRRIGRLDPVFKGVHGIAEAQIVQDNYDKFRVRIVPGSDYTQDDANTIVNNLAARIGGQPDIRIELAEQIERTRAGKFKAVVCNLPEDTKRPRC